MNKILSGFRYNHETNLFLDPSAHKKNPFYPGNLVFHQNYEMSLYLHHCSLDIIFLDILDSEYLYK